MNILLVSPLPPPEGGIATWTIGFKEYCSSRNVNLRIVNTALKGKRGINFNDSISVWDEVKRTRYILSNMQKELRKKDVDIVHINTACSRFGIYRDFICLKKASKYRIPVVLHCHCNIQDQIKTRLAQAVFRFMVKKSTHVVVLNSKSETYVQKLSKTKCEIIPNFINTSIIANKHEIRETIKEAVFVGHVRPSKGIKEIYEVAEQLSDVHFTLIGSVSDEIREMKGLPNVLLVGEKETEQVFNYYKNADIYIFPSHTEGFSLSLVEAMACGLPCIASDVGANKDMLEEGGGIIVPVNDINKIVEAFQQLTSSRSRTDMSNWNIEKVKKSYTRDVVLEKLMRVYKEIL